MTTEPIEDVAPATSLLPGLVQRPPELGRIRMGDKSEKGFPIRLRTFRLTSHSKATLEAAAQLYGGKVQQWTDSPDEGMWELITERDELDVLLPATLSVISQAYEFWQGGTCERRCDGTTEQLSDKPCLCAADELSGPDRLCDVVTRLKVMLPRVPGLGVWRLDTSGYVAATTLPATLQLLARLTPGAWIPAVLRAEQRSKKTRDDKGKVETHRFVVPVLDLPGTTIGQIVGRHGDEVEDQGEKPKPPTAAERAAQRRAQLEAQAGGSVAQAAPEPTPSEGQTGTNPATKEAADIVDGLFSEAPSFDVAADLRAAYEKHRDKAGRSATKDQKDRLAEVFAGIDQDIIRRLFGTVFDAVDAETGRVRITEAHAQAVLDVAEADRELFLVEVASLGLAAETPAAA